MGRIDVDPAVVLQNGSSPFELEGFGNGALVNLRGLADQPDEDADALVSVALPQLGPGKVDRAAVKELF